MIETKLRDHKGLERIIRTADDLNRLIADLEAERDRLADIMLGSDHTAAIEAERRSDELEDGYVPTLEKELARIQALLDADHADEQRRAKAQAIKNRKRGS